MLVISHVLDLHFQLSTNLQCSGNLIELHDELLLHVSSNTDDKRSKDADLLVYFLRLCYLCQDEHFSIHCYFQAQISKKLCAGNWPSHWCLLHKVSNNAVKRCICNWCHWGWQEFSSELWSLSGTSLKLLHVCSFFIYLKFLFIAVSNPRFHCWAFLGDSSSWTWGVLDNKLYSYFRWRHCIFWLDVRCP